MNDKFRMNIVVDKVVYDAIKIIFKERGQKFSGVVEAYFREIIRDYEEGKKKLDRLL